MESRLLTPEDEDALDRFLVSRAAYTLFLRSNLRESGGLAGDPTAPYGGHYAGHVTAAGEIDGAVAHAWNGNAILAAPADAAALVRLAVGASGQPLVGLIGPGDEVHSARQDLGLDAEPTTMASDEILYALDLDQLQHPPLIEAEDVVCRRADASDVALLVDWRAAYLEEALGMTDPVEARKTASENIARGMAGHRIFLLDVDGTSVSMSGFNAAVPDCVQIGGVYTPPPLRRRGYGRTVVAGSLDLVAPEGVTRSILFTDDENVAAQRAYEALGYARIGRYGLLFFAEPVPPARIS